MVAEDGDIERHLTQISTENSDAPMAGGAGAGNGGGWKQLKDNQAVGTARLARVRSGDSKRAGSHTEVAFEMELGSTPGGATGGANAGANRDDNVSAISVTAAVSERVYKVYKRRWFGLVELVLLNIVASFDVS
jgi:FLVCR family MFS transporter 7